MTDSCPAHGLAARGGAEVTGLRTAGQGAGQLDRVTDRVLDSCPAHELAARGGADIWSCGSYSLCPA